MDWPTDVLTDHPIGGPADCEPLPLGISPRLWHRVCQLAQRFERPFVWRYMAPGAPPPIGDPAASQRTTPNPDVAKNASLAIVFGPPEAAISRTSAVRLCQAILFERN